MRPEELCGLLAEPDRLAVFAAVVLGAGQPSEVIARTGLTAREVDRALGRLGRGGLVEFTGAGLVARRTAIKDAVREHAPEPVKEEPLDLDRGRAAVLRAFLRAGRIVTMPAARGKRRILLEHIVVVFEPGVRYPEKEVDAVLRAWHDDYVSVRRYLIDEGLMARENGVYWRTGGYVAT